MTNTVVVGSVHGSPGATTVALGLAGCIREALLVEADCAGGVLAVRLGLAREPNVATLAAHRTGGTVVEVRDHVLALPGRVPILVGPVSAEQATVVWRSAAEHLFGVFDALPVDVVVDAGRLGPRSPLDRLLASVALVLVVARPVPEQLAVLAEEVRRHREGTRLGLVLVGDRPYRPAEVEDELGCPVLGVVPEDRRSVAALYGGGRPGGLARTPFGRSVRALATTVTETGDGGRAGVVEVPG